MNALFGCIRMHDISRIGDSPFVGVFLYYSHGVREPRSTSDSLLLWNCHIHRVYHPFWIKIVNESVRSRSLITSLTWIICVVLQHYRISTKEDRWVLLIVSYLLISYIEFIFFDCIEIKDSARTNSFISLYVLYKLIQHPICINLLVEIQKQFH